MEPEILKYRVKKNFTSILRDLEPRKLLSYLYQEDIFDEDDMDEVRSERTRRKQADALLSMLDRRNPRGYKVLLDALSETQPHLAKFLQTAVPGEEKEKVPKAYSYLEEKVPKAYSYLEEIKGMMEGLHVCSSPTENDVNAPSPSINFYSQSDYREQNSTIRLNTATPDQNHSGSIKTTQLDLISKLYRPNLLESVYKMTSSPRGLAVIINIDDFDGNPKYSPEEKLLKREGSDMDAKGLFELFNALDFETQLLVDLGKDELLSTLGKISMYDFSAYDCFVLCVMSHGKQGFFYTRDGGKITVESVLKMFNNSHCQTLCGKPKLYFIQACRGQDSDFGTIVKDGPSGNPTENEEPQKLPENPKFSFNIKTPNGPSTGEHADQLVAYSSVEGFSSYRNTRYGSRFIRSLVEVFRDYACVEDVESMLTRIIRKVNSQGEIGSKQVPKPETTLTKKVFFWPGLKFDEQ